MAIPAKTLGVEAIKKATHPRRLEPKVPCSQLISREDSRLEDTMSQLFIVRSLTCDESVTSDIYARFFPCVEKGDRVVSVNGVSDTFLGVLLAGLANGKKVEGLINVGRNGAVMTFLRI